MAKQNENQNEGQTGSPTPEGMITPEKRVTQSLVENVIREMHNVMNQFLDDVGIDTNLTGKERQRLFGVRNRKWGFVQNAWAVANENPDFLPPHFSMGRFEEHMRILEQVKNLVDVLDQFERTVTDYQLLTSDNAYRDALAIYGSLREQSNRNVAGATVLFDRLRQYFMLHRPFGASAEEHEATMKEIERDFHSMIKGHKDGEINIKNEKPHVSGGVHEVIDNVHTGHNAMKGSVEEDIKE
jgi:hypothetical protein